MAASCCGDGGGGGSSSAVTFSRMLTVVISVMLYFRLNESIDPTDKVCNKSSTGTRYVRSTW